MVTAVTEDVYKGRDNDFVNSFTLGGIVLDFSAVTRMTLVAGGQGFDTDLDASLISWDGLGVVVFNLIGVNMNSGLNSAVLTAYDPLHPNGQVICHPEGKARLNLNVI